MATPSTDGDSDRSWSADEIDSAAARKLLHWAFEDAEASSVRGPRRHHLSMRRRITHLRAAFVGDVRMSFVVVLAFFFVAAAGWFAAHIWYQEAKESEIETVRAEAAADGQRQVLDYMSRVRSTPEANAQLMEAVQTLYQALQESGYDPDKIPLRTSDPDSPDTD